MRFAKMRGDFPGQRFWPLVVRGVVFLCLLFSGVAAQTFAGFDTNRVMTLELKIAPADWKSLRYEHREAEFFPEESASLKTNAYSWFSAEALINGTNVGRVEVRKKGYIGSNDTKRPALKLRIPANEKGKAERPWPELTLNNNNQDPALIRQSLSYEVFRRAGVPAPLCSFANVTVNGKSLGIYTRVEPINAAFLKEHFGRADGNLYEGGRSDFRPGWFQNFEIKNNTNANHRADLEAATKAIESSQGSLMPVLDRFFDSEEFFRFWAVESLINQSDGYAGNLNNFYLYRHPATGRFVFIPWGADTSLHSGRGLNSTKGDPKSVIGVSILANRLYKSAEGAERYRATLRRVMDQAWKEEPLLQEVNRLEALLAPHLGSQAEDFKQSVESVRRFIAGRRAELSSELDGPVPELKAKPLELAKRRNVGHFAGRFTTVWATVNPSNLSGSGEGTLSGRLWEKELSFQKTTVQAGGMGSDSSEERPMIALIGTTATDEKQYVVYLSIDSESLDAGTPIPIDNTHIFGGLMEMDSKGQSSKMIGMLRGSLLLKTISRDDHGKIEGDFNADVFSKLPKP